MEIIEKRLREFADSLLAEASEVSEAQRKRLAQFAEDLVQAYRLELPLSIRDVLGAGGDIRTYKVIPSGCTAGEARIRLRSLEWYSPEDGYHQEELSVTEMSCAVGRKGIRVTVLIEPQNA